MKSIHDRAYRLMIDRLRAERRTRKMTQVSLARQVGQDQSFVSKYERFERRLDLAELRSLCTALGISLTDFVRDFERDAIRSRHKK